MPATAKAKSKAKPKPKTLDAEAGLDYVLLLLSKSTDFKPDFHATAAAASLTNANTAQKKFKKIVEQGGVYKLEKGQVVSVEDGDDDEDEGEERGGGATVGAGAT